MSDSGTTTHSLSVMALGIALSLTLSVLWILCAVTAMLAPDLNVSHAWLALFTARSPTSLPGFLEGLIANVAVAWISAVVFVPAFRLASRRRS